MSKASTTQGLSAALSYEESDFIVLCEFSEKDGPIPREVIGVPQAGFPLDQFAVRLMSVELKIEVGRKWHVWSQWKSQRVEFLVVHFQLHDLEARGYSRQLAFAYITYAPKKLLSHRQIYVDALYHAADMLMEANSRDWKIQLRQRISDLKSTYCRLKLYKQISVCYQKALSNRTSSSWFLPGFFVAVGQKFVLGSLT